MKFSLLLLILLTKPVLADECYVVSDGQLMTLLHENGHCNGWRHPPFTNSGLPPLEFMHPFHGQMFITVTNDDDDMMIRANALPGTKVARSHRSAAELCVELWHKYHVPVPDNASGIASLVGCAVTLNDQGWVK